MDAEKLHGHLMSIRLWAEKAIVELQSGNVQSINAALLLIENRLEAAREELSGREPIVEETLTVEDLTRGYEDLNSGC